MRKLILLLCLAFAPVTQCFSQCDEVDMNGVNGYINAHINGIANEYLFGLDINIEEALVGGLYLKEDVGIYYAPSAYYGCGLNFTMGVKYKPIDFVYGVIDVQPNVYVHGDGHQVYGDYLLAYLRCGVGLGAVLPIGSNGEVYVEAKVCGDIVVIDETDTHERSGVLMVGVGYRHKFF